MSAEEWVWDAQEDVYDYWKSEHSDWEYGVKMFSSPVRESADILILGYQPGGGVDAFDYYHDTYEEGNFSLPDKHRYLTADWKLARKMRDLFGENTELLADSVKSNIIYFRAPDIATWERLEEKRRNEIEQFCFGYVQELVEQVNPSVILAEGISTWDELRSLLSINTGTQIKRGNHRLVCVSETDDPKVIGIMHPSGAHISREDWERLKRQTLSVLDEQLDENIVY
jgi:hypothetical protein